MGTPRASAPKDQMRKVQRTASGDGDCGRFSETRLSTFAEANRAFCCRVCVVSAMNATTTGEALCPVAGGELSFCGNTHDFIFAQQSPQESFCTGVMLMAQASGK